MAESFIEVTESSGKKLWTDTTVVGADTKHAELLKLAEAHSGVASSTIANSVGASTATANSHLLQIMAPASLKVRVRRIEMWQTAMVTAALLMQTALYRLTTAGTGGTSVTPQALDPTDTPGATAMTLPSSKGTEGALIAYAAPYMMQTLTASDQLKQPVLVWDFDRPRSKPLVIPAGTANGIAIKNVSGAASGVVAFTVWIDETSY